MEDYIVIGRIGEGAHGVVMKGRNKQTGRIVALKKVLLKRLEDGIPATALREIKALQVRDEFIQFMIINLWVHEYAILTAAQAVISILPVISFNSFKM